VNSLRNSFVISGGVALLTLRKFIGSDGKQFVTIRRKEAWDSETSELLMKPY
jgi:hypothetical protein